LCNGYLSLWRAAVPRCRRGEFEEAVQLHFRRSPNPHLGLGSHLRLLMRIHGNRRRAFHQATAVSNWDPVNGASGRATLLARILSCARPDSRTDIGVQEAITGATRAISPGHISMSPSKRLPVGLKLHSLYKDRNRQQQLQASYELGEAKLSAVRLWDNRSWEHDSSSR